MKMITTILSAALLWAGVVTTPSQGIPNFVRVTEGPVVSDSGYGFSLAWGDYDHDGRLDLLAVNYLKDAPAVFLYRNLGRGGFERMTAGDLTLEPRLCWGCAWADYDNDGKLDVYIGSRQGTATRGANTNFFFRNLGNGNFSRITTGDIVTASQWGGPVRWSDYDRDGHLDLFVLNSFSPGGIGASTNSLFHNEGDGTFTAVTSGVVVTDRRTAEAAAWSDLDGDGDLDLVLAAHGYQRLCSNRGDGTFDMAINALTQEKSNGVSLGLGDFDNDGLIDICLGETVAAAQGPNHLIFHNDGQLNFTRTVLGPARGCWAMECADFDNDGWLDLFLSQVQGSNLLYHNNGDGTFHQETTGALLEESGDNVSGADYDDDGFVDLAYTTDTWDHIRLYHNDGNANHWIKFRLVGTTSNRSAIGARVRVKATIGGKTFWQLREIGSGVCVSQSDPRPNFGLGDATQAEVVRIEWPSGIVQELTNVPAGQILTVTEPVQLQSQAAGSFQFQSWKNMVFEVHASEDCSAWSSVSTVTNLTGTIEFTDREGPRHAARFYRVKSQ